MVASDQAVLAMLLASRVRERPLPCAQLDQCIDGIVRRFAIQLVVHRSQGFPVEAWIAP